MKWAYGITTVTSRLPEILPKTLDSLAEAGFSSPKLFVDVDLGGVAGIDVHELKHTLHNPKVGAACNWFLGLTELCLSEPNADYYAMFEDDLEALPGLRDYLEATAGPELGYYNLVTHDVNVELAPANYQGWYLSDQFCRGALALVFPPSAASALVRNSQLSRKFASPKLATDRIIGELLYQRYQEFVHYPSLVQHTGIESTLGHRIGPVKSYDPTFKLCAPPKT